MSDLIDREQAVDRVRAKLDTWITAPDRSFDQGFVVGIDTAVLAIMHDVPSAEKTGKWLSTWHKNEVVCSNCRKYWILATDIYDYKYCPNCGSRMER